MKLFWKTMALKKRSKIILFSSIALLVLIQFIPVDRTNPEILAEPEWDSPETKEFAKRACYDCHSNETKWPFYSYIAPVSWIIAHHVEEGREYFNVHDTRKDHRDEAAEEVYEGKMPMAGYTMFHKDAKLTDEEIQRFIKGLEATFGEFDKEKVKDHLPKYN